jgi:hypothetical protein
LLITVISVPGLFATGVQHGDQSHYLGVYLTEADYQSVSSDELLLFEELGISILEFEGIAPQRVVNLIDESQFRLFITQPRRFITAPELQRSDSLYFQEDLSFIQEYRAQIGEKAAAFGLFIYPDETSTLTLNLLNQYASRFQGINNGELLLYYRSAFASQQNYPASYSFRSTHVEAGKTEQITTQVIHFIPSSNSRESLSELKSVLELSIDRNQSIVFLPYNWLLIQLNEFELLGQILTTYSRNQTLLFAEPDISESAPSPNWVVIIFIVLFGTYIAHYHSSQLYQRSLLRYFTMHKFFIDDVMEYRIRTSISATILFFQHILITGLASYIVADILLSNLGIEALYYHFPILNLFGSGPLGIALFAIFFAAGIQLISVLWLHLINTQSRFSQAMTLYTWPLQINFIVLLILIAVYQSGGSETWAILFSICFILVCVVAFIIAALDIAVYITKYSLLYILLTVGLHVTLIIFLITVIFIYQPVSAPIRFVFLLP